jgi:Phosphotransferase enzyme family
LKHFAMKDLYVRIPSHAELRLAIDEILRRHNPNLGALAGLRTKLCDDQTSFNLVDLDIDLDDGTTLRLLLKDLGLKNLHETARRVKPEFLYNPLREIKTYQEILAPSCLDTAHYYGAVVSSDEDRCWLFLEKISGLRICAINDFSAWLRAARWLAHLHARFAEKSEALSRSVPLLRYDAVLYRQWLARATMFQSAGIGRSVWESLARSYERAIERLVQLPCTLIHGEFFASNILVQETRDGWRIRPVDWEMAAVGPGLIDLAALTSGAWTESERTEMAAAYHDSWLCEGMPGFPLDELLLPLDDCRLHLAIQWLGWAPDWSPPQQNAHDWLAEAITLSEKMRTQ